MAMYILLLCTMWAHVETETWEHPRPSPTQGWHATGIAGPAGDQPAKPFRARSHPERIEHRAFPRPPPHRPLMFYKELVWGSNVGKLMVSRRRNSTVHKMLCLRMDESAFFEFLLPTRSQLARKNIVLRRREACCSAQRVLTIYAAFRKLCLVCTRASLL